MASNTPDAAQIIRTSASSEKRSRKIFGRRIQRPSRAPEKRPEAAAASPRRRRKARLPDLSPVGVLVQAVVPDGDLAFIGDMGGRPGDELQVVHRLLLALLLTVSVADFSLMNFERNFS